MTTALVALNPELGPPAIVTPKVHWGPGRDREDTITAIDRLAEDALWDGQHIVGAILSRVALALRGARGMELSIELLWLLEREHLLPAPSPIDVEVRDAA